MVTSIRDKEREVVSAAVGRTSVCVVDLLTAADPYRLRAHGRPLAVAGGAEGYGYLRLHFPRPGQGRLSGRFGCLPPLPYFR